MFIFSIEGGVYSSVCGVVIWGRDLKKGGWESVSMSGTEVNG